MSAPTSPIKVVVPLDGAVERNPVVAVAAAIAERMGAQLELVSIVSPGLASFDAPELSRQAAAVGIGATSRVLTGNDPVAALTALVDDSDLLLCLPSSGRTALAEALTGSVGAAVIHGASAPLIVVGPECHRFTGDTMAIAVDGTPAGEWIVEPALAIAERLGLEPTLFQVVPAPTVTLDEDLHETSYLARLAARFEGRAQPIGYEVLHERRPGRALSDIAGRDEVAMIAVSSHGMRPYERILLPSVAHHLIRHARCPVLVGTRSVPAEAPFDHGSGPRVVVGVDGSSADALAIEVAADAAEVRQATLEIVHAWARAWYLSADGSWIAHPPEVAEKEAREVLDAAVNQAREYNPALKVRPWLSGRISAEALLDAAKGAELLVLGEHRYNIVEQTVLGSTVTEVLQRCTTPVIVVPETNPPG